MMPHPHCTTAGEWIKPPPINADRLDNLTGTSLLATRHWPVNCSDASNYAIAKNRHNPGVRNRMSDPSKQSVIRTYDRYAPIYDSLFGPIQRAGCVRMAESVAALEPGHILEVGIGTGLTLSMYPERAKVNGIDISPVMLRQAQQRAAGLPSRDIRLAIMDAEQLEFDDNTFDCVAVPYVLSVTPNPDKLVAEIRRVCRPDGHIFIVNHFSGGKLWSLPERLLRSVADKIGFRSNFDYDHHILRHDWTVLSTTPVRLFGLYRLVIIRNG